MVTFQYNKSLLFVLLQWDNFWLSKCHIWPPKFKDQVTAALALVVVWDHILTPTISSTRSENIVTRFSPLVRYFHPLTISNGKSFCSQMSLNFNMRIYNKEPFFILSMTFYRILFITDCWYNPLTYPPKHKVSTAKRGVKISYDSCVRTSRKKKQYTGVT